MPKFKIGDKVMLKEDHWHYETDRLLGKNIGTAVSKEYLVNNQICIDLIFPFEGKPNYKHIYYVKSLRFAPPYISNSLKKKK